MYICGMCAYVSMQYLCVCMYVSMCGTCEFVCVCCLHLCASECVFVCGSVVYVYSI